MSDKFKDYLVEGAEKLKPKLHLLDDKIETFIERIEKRVDEIDDSVKDVEFTLSFKEAEMIFDKLKDEEFKIVKVTSSLMYFLNDLQEATKMTLLPKIEEK